MCPFHTCNLTLVQGQQLTKADFLAELRGKPNSAAAQKPARAAVGVSAAEQAAAPDQPAWEALQVGRPSTPALAALQFCLGGVPELGCVPEH